MARETILVVEDDDLSRKLVCDLLRAMEFVVVEVSTAEDALARVEAEAPSAVVMDVRLPGIDGVSAVRALRRTPAGARLPVLAVSASVMPADHDRIEAAGFDGFLEKPIHPAELLAEVRRLVGKGR